jgi:hypothetical protein
MLLLCGWLRCSRAEAFDIFTPFSCVEAVGGIQILFPFSTLSRTWDLLPCPIKFAENNDKIYSLHILHSH